MKRNKRNAQKSEWLSADGWQSANGWQNSWNNADAWQSANGTPAPQVQQHSSAPYIIQIVNACSSAISSVDIGDSYTNRAASNFNQNSNITTTSTISGVTYQEFLAQSESQPFTVGATMVISTSAGQLDQTIAVTHRNASGDRNDHVITPTLNLYQQQTDRIIDEYEYLFDGMTRLRFNQINGSATVTVRLYLKNKFAATQIIAGRPAEQLYGVPAVVKVNGVALGSGPGPMIN